MQRSEGKISIIVVSAVLIGALLLCVCASSALVIAPLSAIAGGANASGTGGGRGDDACTVPPTPPSGTPTSGCTVVAWAQRIAAHLQMCGADPTIGTPDFDKCYTSSPDPAAMPQVIIDYLASHYPGDRGAWVSGNFQCVSLVVAAYGLAGLPLPRTSDAVIFWANYQALPGWEEIPTSTPPQPGPPGVAPGLPHPGDLMVWQHVSEQGVQDAGHIAIVIGVTPPHGATNGTITFAQANSFAPIASVPLTPDLRVLPWPGGQAYAALGYIRPVLPPATPVATSTAAFASARLLHQHQPGVLLHSAGNSWLNPLSVRRFSHAL